MVTSIVLNDDVVPRMSAQSIEVLADQVRTPCERYQEFPFLLYRLEYFQDKALVCFFACRVMHIYHNATAAGCFFAFTRPYSL